MNWLEFVQSLAGVIFGAGFIRRIVWFVNGRGLDVIFRTTDLERVIIGLWLILITFSIAFQSGISVGGLIVGIIGIWYSTETIRAALRLWKTWSVNPPAPNPDTPPKSQ